MVFNSDNFKSNDSECGIKSVHDSTPATSEPVREELVLLGDNGDVKISSKARLDICSCINILLEVSNFCNYSLSIAYVMNSWNLGCQLL